MFVLKAEKQPAEGKFVYNLRRTIEILTDSCRLVPKTACSHRRPRLLPTEVASIPRVNPYPSDLFTTSVSRSLSSQAVFEMDLDLESELELEISIEAEEVVLLQEPVGGVFE